MSKKLLVILVVAVALIASSAYATQWAERNTPPATKEKPEVKDGPGPAGNVFFGNPRTDLRTPLGEGFESGAIPANWTVYNEDGDAYQWEAYSTTSAHSGSYVARVHWNSLGCDDWLITPRLTVASGDSITFWAKTYSSSYPEDFEVLLSTTGNAVGDFTVLLDQVFATPYEWTQYTYDLSAYDGQNIYVAVRCISVDAFYLYVDDFSGPEIWVPAGPAIAFNTTDLEFGTVTVGSSESLPLIIYSVGASDLTVSGVVSDNAHFTHDFPGVTAIPPGDSLVVTVTFTPTADPLETGTLTVTHDGTKTESYIAMSGSGFSGLLSEDFMGTFPPTGWTTYQLGDPAGWAQGAPGYDDAYDAFHDDFYGVTACDDWLVFPAVSLPAKAVYELEFMQYVRYPTYTSVHSVMISTGSGVPPTDFVQLYEVPHGDGYIWEAIEDISLAAYAGQTVYLAFRYEGGYDSEWHVDNVVVQEFIYVNEPPVIIHDPKGDTWDTTPTFTAFITDVEGFTASLFYQPAGTKDWTEVAMSPTGVLPDEYYTSFLSYGPLNYYVKAVDDSGLVAVEPPGAPTRFYSYNTFEIQPIVGDEIVYDDGTVENATCWLAGYEANRFAVRFSPPAYPCTLTAVKLGIAGDWPDERHQPFLIEVYDDDGAGGLPGTLLYGPDTTGSIGNVIGGVQPYPALEWAFVCIHPLVIITEGDFYVAKGQTTVNPECEGLDIDDDGVQYSRSYTYSYTSGTWSQYYPGDRNLLIRAYTSQITTIGHMAGTVIEAANGPIEGAIVTAVGIDTKSDTTDASGNYFIADLTSGLYDVTATAAGYSSQTQFDVVVPELDTAIVDFALVPYGEADVLLVDADGSYYLPDAFTDVQAYFTEALATCGYTYDIWEKTDQPQDGPDHTIMELYDAVVWFTGEAWQLSQTLTATDEVELGLYLDGGGKLFLSAQDYLYDRYPSAGSFSPGQFPYDYLGVSSVSQDVVTIVDPDIGHSDGYAGSVADGLAYDLSDPYTTAKAEGDKGPDDGLYIDDMVFMGDPVFDAFFSPDYADYAAVQYEGTVFKTVFTTVDFAGLVEGTHTRAELMCAIMDWFLAPPAEMWLSNGSVNPIIGSLSTPFTYSVTYTQINDIAPTVANVYVDGSPYAMTDPTSGMGPYAGGVVFTYTHTFDQGGDHDFYFDFSDGTNSDRLPASGAYWGPMNGFYNYDFEASNGGFTPTGPFDEWEWGVPTAGPGAAHSGDHCWGIVLAGNYSNNSQSRLETPSLDFTSGGDLHLELKFWHWYDSEGSYSPYDGGNVKLITPTETVIIYPDLSQAEDYDTYAMSTANAWIPGEPAYFGPVSGWKEAIFDLTPWTDESDVKIAFDFGSDGSVNSYDGWYIDDVVIWGYPPLPVELAGFTATAGDQVIRLAWETRSELNNLGFELYRRTDGSEFEKITAQRIPGAGNSDATQRYTYVDKGLVNGTTYYYQLAAVDFGGNITRHDLLVSATPMAVLPTTFALSQNYPNPFNPNTEIKYQIPEDSRVVLKIHNIMGQEVLTLMDADVKAGYYTATWNARDARGQEVSAGIYFCTLQAGEFNQTVKMVLLK